MRSTRIGDTKHLTNTTQHARLITGEGELGLSWVFLSKAFDLFERVCYNGLRLEINMETNKQKQRRIIKSRAFSNFAVVTLYFFVCLKTF